MAFEVKVPNVGESINEVTIGEWVKVTGDFVKEGDVLCELESEKATFDILAKKSGILTIYSETGEFVSIDAVIAIIEEANGANGANEVEKVKEKPSAEEKKAEVILIKDEKQKESLKESPYNLNIPQEKAPLNYASPASQKLMRETGITADQFIGSGKLGRILKEDVLIYEDSLKEKIKENPTLSNISKDSSELTTEKELMHFKKFLINEQLKNQHKMLIQFATVEVNLYNIEKIRSKYQAIYLENYQIKISPLSFIIKAVLESLKEHFYMNAYLEEDTSELIAYENYNIAIEFSTPFGRIAPVIQNVDRLKCYQIEQILQKFKEKANNFALKVEDLESASFTISDFQDFSSILSSTNIPPKQVANLVINSIIERPIIVNKKIKIRPILYLALFYNSCIIDKKEALDFLMHIKELLEDPYRIFI